MSNSKISLQPNSIWGKTERYINDTLKKVKKTAHTTAECFAKYSIRINIFYIKGSLVKEACRQSRICSLGY